MIEDGTAMGAPIPPRPPYGFKGDKPPRALTHLRDKVVWITWDHVWREKQRKWAKPPHSAATGRMEKDWLNAPGFVGTWDQALATMRRRGLAGIGISLGHADLRGVDLDDCIGDSDSFTDLAAKVIAFGETYCEISQSGEGVHFLTGSPAPTIKRDDLRVELYSHGRYFVVTGNKVEDAPDEIGPAPRLIEHLTRLDAETPKPNKERTAPTNGHIKPGSGGDFFANVNSMALARLDAWVPPLHPSAKKQPTGGWRVASSDLGRDLEEDISYHPSGITDFGEEHGATAIDAVMRFGTEHDAKGAAMWLCRQMGVEPAALGWGRREGLQGADVRDSVGTHQVASAAEPESANPTPHVPAVFRSVWDALKTEPNPRIWHLPDWMPGDDVTGFWADGGTGKTNIGMQMGYCTASCMPFLGMPIRAGGAIYFTAEEHNDEFDFRAHQIANGIIVPEEATRHPFEVVSGAGEDALLCRFSKVGVLEPTPLWRELVERIGDLKCAFVGIDPAADVYGGNEIDRAQVRAFINMLRKPAIEHKCAILLAGHASVDGLKTGRGYSGSTAWHNSVRARWYFQVPTAGEDDEEPNTDLRELSLRKTNRGKAGQRLLLQWHDGWFGLCGSDAGRSDQEAQTRDRFLTLLARFQSEGRGRVSPNKGPTYAPACFEQHPNGKPFKSRQYHAAMDALLASGQLRVVTEGSPSRQRSYLVRA
jgi:hypothetical protein